MTYWQVGGQMDKKVCNSMTNHTLPPVHQNCKENSELEMILREEKEKNVKAETSQNCITMCVQRGARI